MSSITPLPFFFISQNLVDQRTSAFVSQKNNLLSQAIKKTDTQSIWYSRDHIAGLLDEIDHASGDGLRIFLGMYETGHQYEGQLCLVMNATRPGADGSGVAHQNVILENEPDFLDRSTMEKGAEELWEKGYNLGSPCPPICD